MATFAFNVTISPCHQAMLSRYHLFISTYFHLIILSSVSLIACKFVNLSIYQLINLLGYKLVSFSACASWSLRAYLIRIVLFWYYLVLFVYMLCIRAYYLYTCKTRHISELSNLFLLLTILARVKVPRPVVHAPRPPSKLKNQTCKSLAAQNI